MCGIGTKSKPYCPEQVNRFLLATSFACSAYGTTRMKNRFGFLCVKSSDRQLEPHLPARLSKAQNRGVRSANAPRPQLARCSSFVADALRRTRPANGTGSKSLAWKMNRARFLPIVSLASVSIPNLY